MKTNEDLQTEVQEAIKWEPLLHAAEIGVIAKDGVITLTGTVDSYAKKLEAEDAVKRVLGVKAVVENIKIHVGHMGKKSDGEIANEVLNAFNWNWAVPFGKVKIKVEDGWVTLAGDLGWNYQKEAAKNSIKGLSGVRGVSNAIKIQSESLDDIEKRDIDLALLRNWTINNKKIDVNVSGNTVTLSGTVYSLYEKEEAERIAWKASGVKNVDNELVID